MADIKNILVYLIDNYPHKSEISNARLTKMVYLADWHHTITHENQISPIHWYFDNYGPFVRDVLETAQQYPNLFSIIECKNIYGKNKVAIETKNHSYDPILSLTEKSSLDHVISETHKLNWSDFIKLVYSTYPILSSERYSQLDLVSKSNEYLLT